MKPAIRVILVYFVVVANNSRAADDPAFSKAQREHWAWKSVARPAPPEVRDRAKLKNPIDAFILAKIESAGLKPAPAASREQLIRRVTFDLIGLPPTPDEIDAFVSDKSANAWEKVIDRLLASPHYGERWGRHWLDLARFAESNGYEFDEIRPDAWRYRDYVIESFNKDKPYDRFIREQLAGDELDHDNPQALIATGFNLLGPDMTDSSDKVQRRQNTLDDMTDTAGSVFLGLTFGCARCHDHKFEPITQSDYYRMQAFYTQVQFRLDMPVATREQRPAIEAALKEYNAKLRPLQNAVKELEEPHRRKLLDAKLARLPEDVQLAHRTPADKRTKAQNDLVEKTIRQVGVAQADMIKAMNEVDAKRHGELLAEIKKVESKKPAAPIAMAIQDAPGPPPKTFMLVRGSPGSPGEEVVPGFLSVVSPNQKPVPATVKTLANSTGRRTALANWVANDTNPLTARVMVNRIWQHHFGRGIVSSASDFGLHGEKPTHPELLDWLAREFTENGWSIKKMHKLMLMSATYQQSSMTQSKEDPENRLFARMNRMRLEGEIIRDNLLAVSGRLHNTMGGRGVFPPIPEEALKGTTAWPVSANKEDRTRRSIYIFARRNLRFPFLETFDLPDSNLSCPKRERSTTAPQALALLNNSDVIDAAKALAARVDKEAKSKEERVTLAYRLAFGRKPSATEAELAGKFLDASPMNELCRALFNLNEFVYLD
jgi:Protein of unknown function (DUF1553)/Protein of unknown function (DUF1549)